MKQKDRKLLFVLIIAAFLAMLYFSGALFEILGYRSATIPLGTGTSFTVDLSPYVSSTGQITKAYVCSACDKIYFFSSRACPGYCNMYTVLSVNGVATHRSECWSFGAGCTGGGRDECFEPQPPSITQIIKSGGTTVSISSDKGLCDATLNIEYLPECVQNADCLVGYECVDGRCTAVAECLTASDCEGKAHIAVPGHWECTAGNCAWAADEPRQDYTVLIVIGGLLLVLAGLVYYARGRK